MRIRSGHRIGPMAAICLAIVAFILVERGTSRVPLRAQEDHTQGTEIGKLVYDRSQPGIRSAAILVPIEEFTLGSLQKIAQRFVGSTHDMLFAELLIGSDENELTLSERGTIPRTESESTFCETLEQLRRLSGRDGLPANPIARVFVVENNALLSFRQAGIGQVGYSGVQEAVIAGDHDPTLMKVGTKEHRLLHFSVTSWNEERALALFFKSRDQPSCTACQQLAVQFQRRRNANSIEVNIRQDTWFASEYFPLMFRFEPDNTEIVYHDWKDQIVPPKIPQYYRGSHVRCALFSQRFSCSAYGRYEHVP